jgi:hypothetical protein
MRFVVLASVKMSMVSCGIQRHVVFQVDTSISKEDAAFIFTAMNIQAVCSFETSISFYKFTWRYSQ